MRRFALFLLCLTLWMGALGRDAFDRYIDATALPNVLGNHSVEVRDRNDRLLRAFTVENGRWRLNVTPDQVDPEYVRMLIAFEDKRFYSHAGVDPLTMVRAAGQALWNGRVVSGGSTLTMQVARLLENGGTRQWSGKWRQMRVALALERRLSKRDILRLYLTNAPFGGNLEGVRAATLAYFGKEPHRLTHAEAALLVALPQSPETRRPDRFQSRAMTARDHVLQRLHNKGVLSSDALTIAINDPLPTQKAKFPALAPHLSHRAKSERPDTRVHRLTLDATLQQSLETLAASALHGQDSRLSIAIVVADHSSGEILSSIGSANYSAKAGQQGYVDMTVATRSPGSTLKPLVYGLAFDLGLAHPETIIADQPVQFGTYAPQNFDGQIRGELRVADALRLSLNIPAVLLTDALGPARLMSALRASGAKPKLPGGQAGLAVVLGGVGVTLEDLTQLYAVQANEGKVVPLTWRTDQPIASHQSRILSRASAWHLSHILAQNVSPFGGTQNRLAYKTGTSYGHRDAWAIGYDGDHVAGVWIGRPDGTPVPGAFGGDLAAPVLFEVFQRLKPELTPFGPPPPETLMVSAAALPPPLQRFKGRNAVFQDTDAPSLIFPPNGARMTYSADGVLLRVRDGALPVTVLANGLPMITRSQRREMLLPLAEVGASTLTVIDAKGRSDQVNIWVE